MQKFKGNSDLDRNRSSEVNKENKANSFIHGLIGSVTGEVNETSNKIYDSVIKTQMKAFVYNLVSQSTDMIATTIKGLTSAALYGSNPPANLGNQTQKVSYTSYQNPSNVVKSGSVTNTQTNNTIIVKGKLSEPSDWINNLAFEKFAQANDTLSFLRRQVRQSGVVSVKQLYSYLHLEGSYTMNDYGWKYIPDNSCVVSDISGSCNFKLQLPDPAEI